MLRYTKGKSPKVLSTWQSTPGAAWDSLPAAAKTQLRKALVHDQGYLCAYCQRRIAANEARMKIEHWNARSTARTTDKKSTFRWSNLLGVCLGDEAAEGGLKAGEQHCDTSKGNARLFLHPVEGQGPNPSEYLRYTHEGKVRPIADAADVAAAAQSDIEVLNLNARRLQRARQEIFDELRRRLERSNFSAASLNAEYRAATIRPGEKAVEQCEFVRYMVRRWARKNGYASPT